MINRRTWLQIAVLSALLTACVVPPLPSGRHRTSLARALLQVQASRSEKEVTDRLGPPNGTANFYPGNEVDPASATYRFRRKNLPNYYIVTPPNLFDTLPTKTRLIYYMFDYSNHVTGDFQIAIDSQGLILGWSYSRMLEGGESQAGLIDHN